MNEQKLLKAFQKDCFKSYNGHTDAFKPRKLLSFLCFKFLKKLC